MSPLPIDIRVIQSASERGISYASWMMSVLCRSGIEKNQSNNESIRYLKTAVVQGSLRAQRDLALLGFSGDLPEISRQRAIEMMTDLVKKKFDRMTLGRKLLFLREPELVKVGYESLKELSMQEINYTARYLTALYEAIGSGLSENNEDNLQLLQYQLSRGDENQSAKRAVALSNLLGIHHQQCTPEDIINTLLEAETPEAAGDALQLLGSVKFKSCSPELKAKAFKQVEAFAQGGNKYAEVLYTAQMLLAAPYVNEGDLALHLMDLLSNHPHYHFPDFDGLLHNCKEHDARLAPAMFEMSRKLAESEVSPFASRTWGIELLMADQPDEALSHLLRSIDFGFPGAVRPLASCFGSTYVSTGINYEDTRFWHEVLVWEHAETGAEFLATLLRSKAQREPLNHQEILSLKNCLETLHANNDKDATRELALLLLRGHGPILPDRKRGLELLNEAAKSDGRAMYELAHVYQAGVFVPRDFCLAKYYFELAGKNGHSNAIYDQFVAESRERERNEDRNQSDSTPTNVAELPTSTRPKSAEKTNPGLDTPTTDAT